MNYFIAQMKTIDKDKDNEILKEHIAYLEEQIDAGKILAKGPFTDHTGGMIIFNVDSLEEAKEIAAKDPAAIEKSREFIFKEWKCSKELS
ncbi:MAG TPA: YciI family protein [Bacillota bacterium]|nr:YciI family protein [Bacillota bacterium]